MSPFGGRGALLWQLRLYPLPPQEPKTDQDEEHCRKVNEYLNNPPMPGALGASGSGGHELSALGGNGHLPEHAGVSEHVARSWIPDGAGWLF